eukprot:scaffold23424_cov121-Isochrysis_galbana.AAC.6
MPGTKSAIRRDRPAMISVSTTRRRAGMGGQGALHDDTDGIAGGGGRGREGDEWRVRRRIPGVWLEGKGGGAVPAAISRRSYSRATASISGRRRCRLCGAVSGSSSPENSPLWPALSDFGKPVSSFGRPLVSAVHAQVRAAPLASRGHLSPARENVQRVRHEHREQDGQKGWRHHARVGLVQPIIGQDVCVHVLGEVGVTGAADQGVASQAQQGGAAGDNTHGL